MNLLSIVFILVLGLSQINCVLHQYKKEGKYNTNISFTVQFERPKGQYLWVSLQNQLQGFNKESLNERRSSEIIKVQQFVEDYNAKSLNSTKNNKKNKTNKKQVKNQSIIIEQNQFKLFQAQSFDIQMLQKGHAYYYLGQSLEIRISDSKLIGKFVDKLQKFLQVSNLKLLIADIRWDTFDALDKISIISTQDDLGLNKSELRSTQDSIQAKLLLQMVQLEAKKKCSYLNMQFTSVNNVENLENNEQNASIVQFQTSNWLEDLDEFQFQEMTYSQLQQVRLELQFQEYDTSIHEVNATCSSNNQNFSIKRQKSEKKEKIKKSIKQKESAKPLKQGKSSKQKIKKGNK